jgi:uncharacterized protein YecE (DUF72 family)
VGRGRLYVGTSGFAYQEWVGVFYPPGTRDRGMLPYYSGRFPSVEVNYTFQRTPSPSAVADWVERTPEGFVFALKAPRRITHPGRLGDVDEAVRQFLEAVAPLGSREGPILFQCPPNLRRQPGLLERFLERLPGGHRYVVEFRHESWDAADVAETLAAAGVARCVADTDERAGSFDPASGGGPFAYLRLRRASYDDEALTAWAQRVRAALERGTDVYAYLKHEDKGTGPAWAERLRTLAEGAGSRPGGGAGLGPSVA